MNLPTGIHTAERYKIDRLDKLPLYEQIERNLRELILAGELMPGEAVPSEWELASRYGVSRLTVRRAIDDLVRQEWLSRKHGVGTFVGIPTVTSIAPSKLSFTQEMLAIGRRPSSQLLSIRLTPADLTFAQRLAVEEGALLVEITRLRQADGVAILLETAYLSSERFQGLENETSLELGSLYDCLAIRYGETVARVDYSLKAILLDEEQADWLGVQAGSPSIFSECTAYNSEGEPVEYSRSVANNEYSQFYFSFRRGEG
jgi:GntR family transcriptional regulator